jgi:hypothetical protein
MSAAASSSPAATTRRLLLPAACGLLLALAMIRLPVVTDVEPGIAYRTMLYETLRLGHAWTDAATADGPLAALQAPAYLGGSIWMAVAWQVAGNLLLAGVLTAAAFRLPWLQRGWALALQAVLLSRWPEAAPWLVMTLLGYDLVRDWAREPRSVLLPALVLGFLSLFSLGHLLLGALAVALVVCTARPPLARVGVAGAFLAGLAGGWLVLGQAWPELARWIVRGFPLLAADSALDRFTELGALVGWALVTSAGFVALVVVRRDPASARHGPPAATWFLLAGAWLAWKTVVLQPNGQPAVFFATIVLGAFILWPAPRLVRWAILPVALALAGLAGSQPGFFSDALGHFNRQAVFGARQLAGLRGLRASLGAQVQGLKQAHAWPRIQAAVGRNPVAALGDAQPRALLNNLVLAPLDLRNPAALEGPDAPHFVVQGLPASTEVAPGLAHPAAQLSLYRHYELQAEEKGFWLWRRKPGIEVPPAALPVAHGSLPFGAELALPVAANPAHWLQVDLHRNWLGWLWSLFGEVPAPGLLVFDDAGGITRYTLPPAAGANGFLVDPLVRGNVDFARWQSGAHPARTVAVRIEPPAHAGWFWSNRCSYRLSAVSGLALQSRAFPAGPDWQAGIFNRAPVGSTQAIPFGVAELAPGDPVLFAHPTSIVEFAVTGADRRVHGSFGLLPGAYQGASTTDGVDFSVEFVGADGDRRVLYHRYLNPRDEIADQGTQYFTAALPEGTGGRLLLRVWNPPYRTAAWDWAFWRNVVID